MCEDPELPVRRHIHVGLLYLRILNFGLSRILYCDYFLPSGPQLYDMILISNIVTTSKMVSAT